MIEIQEVVFPGDEWFPPTYGVRASIKGLEVPNPLPREIGAFTYDDAPTAKQRYKNRGSVRRKVLRAVNELLFQTLDRERRHARP